MGCGASKSGDVIDPQPLPSSGRARKFGGWENEAGWGELGSEADPQTPEMDALWKVLPAALSDLQLKPFQRVLMLNAPDLHCGLKTFMALSRKGAGTVHSTRLAMAADMPAAGNGNEISPLLKRFIYTMSGCEGDNRELTFRSFMVCLRVMFKQKATQHDKLKFWFNVMKCSDKSGEEETTMSERISSIADFGMVANFLADTVVSDVGGMSAQNKARSRVMMGVKTSLSSGGFNRDDIVGFAHFSRVCIRVTPSYAATLNSVYDRLRSAFALGRGGKVTSLGTLKIKAYFYNRSQQMLDLQRDLGTGGIADNAGWKHSFTGDKNRRSSDTSMVSTSIISSFADSDGDEAPPPPAPKQPPPLSNARGRARVPFSTISYSGANSMASSSIDGSLLETSTISKVRIDESAFDLSVASQASSAPSKEELKSALRSARACRHMAAQPREEDVLQEVEEEVVDGKEGFLLQAFEKSLEYLESVRHEEAARAAAMRKERDERIRGIIEREMTAKPVGIYIGGGQEEARGGGKAGNGLRRARIADVEGGRAKENLVSLSSSREFHGFDTPKVGAAEGRMRRMGTPFNQSLIASPARSGSLGDSGRRSEAPYSSDKATAKARGRLTLSFEHQSRGLAVDDLMATPLRGQRERMEYDDSVTAMARLTFGGDSLAGGDAVSVTQAAFASNAQFTREMGARGAADKPWLAAAMSRASAVGAY